MRVILAFYGLAVLTCLGVALAILFGCAKLYSEPPGYRAPPALIQLDRTWLANHAYRVESYDRATGEWIIETRHLTQAEAMEGARRLRREKALETIATQMQDPYEIVAWYRP